MNPLNKIFIIYANSGAGHRRAAEALNTKAKDYFPQADIRLFDALDYTSPLFKRTYPMIYLFLVNHCPWLWGVFYYFLDNRYIDKFARIFRRNTNSFYGKAFINFLLDEKPDLILTTHFLPNELVSFLKKRYRFQTILITCITDYYPHAWWRDSGVDLYIAPSRDLKPRLIQLGISEERIIVIGIPIHPVFGEKNDKVLTRQKLGISTNPFTILITSGGFGVGPIKKLVNSLKHVMTPLQILVICGNNPKLQNELTELTNKTIHNIHIYGFIQNMHEFMAASDIMLSKSGGLTSTEAMAIGLPLITLKPIPGQESGNCEFILKNKAGIRIKTVREARKVLEKLLNNQDSLNSMRENMSKIGRPHAVNEILAYIKEYSEKGISK